MTAKTLYALNDDLDRLADMLYESGGEITEEIDRYLTDTELEVQEKVARYVSLIRNLETMADLKKAEAKRLSDSRKADENIADKLRARLEWFFGRQELKTLRTRIGTITRSLNPSRQKPELLISEAEVPAEYKTQITVEEVDYGKIKDALQAGVELEWVRPPKETYSIRIR